MKWKITMLQIVLGRKFLNRDIWKSISPTRRFFLLVTKLFFLVLRLFKGICLTVQMFLSLQHHLLLVNHFLYCPSTQPSISRLGHSFYNDSCVAYLPCEGCQWLSIGSSAILSIALSKHSISVLGVLFLNFFTRLE